MNTVRLIRMRDNGIPEWLTVPHDLLEKTFRSVGGIECWDFYLKTKTRKSNR